MITAMKRVSEDSETITLEGYGVVFGGRDLMGDYFTPETNFFPDLLPEKMVLYEHNMDPSVKGVIGRVRAEDIRIDDKGMWIRAQLDRHAKYTDAIAELADYGILGFSSGSIPQLVEYDSDGRVKSWPIVEFSPTPIPAEPRTIGIANLKSIKDADVAKFVQKFLKAKEDDPEEETKGEQAAPSDSKSPKKPEEKKDEEEPDDDSTSKEGTKAMDMPNVNTGAGVPEDTKEWIKGLLMQIRAEEIAATPAVQPQAAAAKSADNESLHGKINQLLDFMESNPALRNAGFFSQTGGKSDAKIKSFPDFLLSIKRRDIERLTGVYKSMPEGVKALGELTGSSGGFLVPEEYETTLLQLSVETNQILSSIKHIPVSSDAGHWPALDQYMAPTPGTGMTAYAGGVKTTPTEEGTALAETEPAFSMLEWRLNKIGGYTVVDNELIEDSPQAIESLLTGLFSVAVAAKNERNVLRGSGAGEPLGILNALCAVGVNPAVNDKFSGIDVATMISRFKSAGGQPKWLMHPSIWPDIFAFEVITGEAAWTINMQGPAGQNINGWPMITSEHLPQANNSGAVLLADLAAYILFEKRGIAIAYSEHAKFVNDQGTWRFTQRNDGMPWLMKPITLADPQGNYTVSPFVFHND